MWAIRDLPIMWYKKYSKNIVIFLHLIYFSHKDIYYKSVYLPSLGTPLIFFYISLFYLQFVIFTIRGEKTKRQQSQLNTAVKSVLYQLPCVAIYEPIFW